MTRELIPLSRVLARLGLDPSSEDSGMAFRLLLAISDEVRTTTRRAFEGEPTTYTQQLRTDGTGTVVMLPNAPVASVTSVARAAFDGTASPPWPATAWRLEDPVRGRVEIAYQAEFVEVVYVATGEIPARVAQAVEDWVFDRWGARSIPAGQTGYKTGEDAETWSPDVAGRPSAAVSRSLASASRLVGGVI